MKARIYSLVLLFSFFNVFATSAAIFKSGEDITINEGVDDNLYIAGNNLFINAPVMGDLRVASSSLTINDTIYEDLLAAASEILIDAYIGDDATLFGENIRILNSIGGDLIVFGSKVFINKEVNIEGDLLVFAGQCTMNGNVNGKLKIRAEKVIFNGSSEQMTDIKAEVITMNGKVYGDAQLAANEIIVEENTIFHQEVEYWQKEGEMDFSPYMRDRQAQYNPDLQMNSGKANWKYLGIGLVAFWILYSLSVILLIIVFGLLMPAHFKKAGKEMNEHIIQNIAYGLFYFVGIAILTTLCIVSIIGIPIGLLLLNLYILSILFSIVVSALLLAHWFDQRHNKQWSKWQIILLAIVIFPFLKVISLIPIVGMLFIVILVCMVFGALIKPCLEWFNINTKPITDS